MPERLQGKLQEALTAHDLLEQRSQIGLFDVRLRELMERLEAGDSTGRLEAIDQALTAFQHDPASVEKWRTVRRLVQEARDQDGVWEDIKRTALQQDRLITSERKRLMEMDQYITVTQARVLVDRIQEIIFRNVTNKRELSAIGWELKLLLEAKAPSPQVIDG